MASVVFAAPVEAVTRLASASGFAVLGGSTVTNAGASLIAGDIGVSPGTSITGVGALLLFGQVHPGDAIAAQAIADAEGAATSLSSLVYDTDLSGQDLGSLAPLTPGVYHFDTSAQLTGDLVLDFASAPDKPFIFQIGTTLTTAVGAGVRAINGGAASAIYWLVGTSATLGAGSDIVGNVVANQSITFHDAARILCGRGIALRGAGTLIGNLISNDCSTHDFGSGRSDFGSHGFDGRLGPLSIVPEPATWTTMLAAFAMTGLAMRRRRSAVRA